MKFMKFRSHNKTRIQHKIQKVSVCIKFKKINPTSNRKYSKKENKKLLST